MENNEIKQSVEENVSGLKNNPVNNKKPLSSKTKYVLFFVSAILLIAGAVFIFNGLKTESYTDEDVMLTYEVVADSNYKVFLKENNVFKENPLEEGRMYSSKLTNHIEVDFLASITGTANVNISGDYRIDGYLEGFRTTTTEQQIYEKKYSLKKGEFNETNTNNIKLNDTVKISPSYYLKDVISTEEALGGSTERRFYLVFQGNYTIDYNDRKEEGVFSYTINLPVVSQDTFYSVAKPEATRESRNISDISQTEKSQNPKMLYTGAALLILAGAILGYVFLFTRSLNEKEVVTLEQSEILRKYGSRFIKLEKTPEFSGKNVIFVKNIDSLLILAEETRTPIFYELDDNGNIVGNKFFAIENDILYICQNSKLK